MLKIFKTSGLMLSYLLIINNAYSVAAVEISNNKYCNIPSSIPIPKLQKIDCKNKAAVDYYMLSLSWSPQYCYGANSNSDNKIQCVDNKFGFVVHGLWPQKNGASGKCDQPRNCTDSIVDTQVVKENLCILPSVKLIQGEWQKHGSCAFSTPKDYYLNVNKLWNGINKPDLIALQFNNNRLKVDDVINAFIKENKGLNKQNINVIMNNKKFLEEVRICYSKDMQYTSCEKSGAPGFMNIKITN
jgi:ribonuclease T2